VSANLTIRHAGDVAVLVVAGRITLGDASLALQEKIRGLITEGHTKIVVNLSGVTFMDSAGIGELVTGFVSVSHSRGKMKVCELTKRMRDLLQVTRLYSVLDVHEREEDALLSFR